MDTKDRKRKEAAVMALKQASIIKTMALASVAFRNGTMKVVPLPEVAKRKLKQSEKCPVSKEYRAFFFTKFHPLTSRMVCQAMRRRPKSRTSTELGKMRLANFSTGKSNVPRRLTPSMLVGAIRRRSPVTGSPPASLIASRLFACARHSRP